MAPLPLEFSWKILLKVCTEKIIKYLTFFDSVKSLQPLFYEHQCSYIVLSVLICYFIVLKWCSSIRDYADGSVCYYYYILGSLSNLDESRELCSLYGAMLKLPA